MKDPLRLGYITAIWGREWLTRKIFEHVANLRELLYPDIELLVAVAGSEGEKSRNLAEKFNFKYVEIPNSPLGAKWNAALGVLRHEAITGVCIFGSDDLVNEDYFRKLSDEITQGHLLVGVDGLYFFDHETGRIIFWQGYPPPRRKEAAGAGRFIGRPILERMDWQLWPPEFLAGLDRGMSEGLANAGYEFDVLMPCENNGSVVMDIKGHGGMNGFEQIAASGASMLLGDPYAFLVRNFNADLAASFLTDSWQTEKCQDCWLWRPFPEAGEAKGDGSNRTLWTLAVEKPLSYLQDFLLAAHQGGLKIEICELLDFLQKCQGKESGREAFYGGMTGETLIAMLGVEMPRILDYRSITDKEFERAALRLPLTRANYLGADYSSLPLPFSLPQGYPCFRQRAHIMLCTQDPALIATCKTIHETNPREDKSKLFHLRTGQQLVDKFGELWEEQLFPLRALFRVVIFTPEEWASAAYFISGGTPGICIGHWPFGDKPECIFEVEDPFAAWSVASYFLDHKTVWNRAAALARAYTRKQTGRFHSRLNALFEMRHDIGRDQGRHEAG